nr:MAG TPA: hypothetical protein [Caudoviricetes sp.]
MSVPLWLYIPLVIDYILLKISHLWRLYHVCSSC